MLSVDGGEVGIGAEDRWYEAHARGGYGTGLGGASGAMGGMAGGDATAGGAGASGGGGAGMEVEGEEGELGFRELTTLEFVAPLSFIKTFLMQIGTTQLRHIGIESSVEGVVDRRDLLACVARRWRDTITHIRMVHTQSRADDTLDNPQGGVNANANDDDEDDSAPTISMDTLSPLLELTKLEHLEIDNYALELTDSNVADMAGAPWAETIHTLVLPFMPPGTIRPSVLSLQILSRRCRELRDLTIPLDTNDFLGLALLDEVGPTARTSLHRLQSLTVASLDEPWELARSMKLARVIDQLFPVLHRVKAADEREGGRWGQVHQMVKMCQAVRSEALRESGVY